ncbi:EF-hand domain-containing protein [Curvibacter gracilis]|uniref:EF-hand domain-containing protein n=1 Tax=Curvibacter gracilis TaxID=230310 RepID=UPI0004861FD5|nr:EF-hand domain-containing protein [Curvibacter gracilis]
MSSLSTVTSASHGWASAMPPRPPGGGKAAERLFSQFDTDSSGSVDSTELQNLLSDVSQKTGISLGGSTASDLLSTSDSNGDGSLSASELGEALKSVLPPPTTMDFVQSRSSNSTSSTTATGQAGDDLFSQLDTNGDSSVSQDELQSLLDQMASDQGNSSSALSASDVISQLDTNGDGSLSASELDAARPQGQDGPPQGGMPPPPPPLTDSSLNSSSLVTGASNASSTEDPLQALFNTIDSDQSGDISSSEAQTFLSQLASQLDGTTGSTGTGSSSGNSSSDSSNSSSSQSDSSSTATQDLVQLVQAARREYQAHMHGWNSVGSQLSASA